MIATILAILAALFHLSGIVCGAHAVYHARSSQGAIAWALSLVMFPYLVVPLYLVFGRSRFQGYVQARREVDEEHRDLIDRLREAGAPLSRALPDQVARWNVLESLAKMPFTRGNHIELLVDGKATFDAIFAAIERAERYILIEFFIVHDDELGRALKDRLIAKARAGVTICFVYDEVGSYHLPSGYVAECKDAGIDIRPFNTTRGVGNRFQVNFRNHRKIAVVDGIVAFVGGLNVGDEYLGKGPLGPWRDTHVSVSGPAAVAFQLTFFEDWRWAGGQEPPGLEWIPSPSERGDMDALVLASGPADELETIGLALVQAIHGASERIWIASPYFVPTDEVVVALHLAALRGVDVRILLPENPDHLMVYLASFIYIKRASKTGAKFYRYQEGFMHQKVGLFDDRSAFVGTTNLDTRSFRLNFEVNLLCRDPAFAKTVEAMFERDFARSRLCDPDEIDSRPIWFRFGSQVGRLLSPIL